MLLSISRLSLVVVEVFGSNEENNQVTGDEGGEDTEIPPSVAEVVSKRSVELVANLVSAVLAHAGHVVADVAWPTTSEEVAHVGTAGLALWCSESVKLVIGALNHFAVKFRNHHTTNQSSERVELVKPNTPELRDGRLGDGDTAEEREDDLQ